LCETVEYTDARFLPGSTSIGQIDWPSCSVLAGSLKPMPALVSAPRKLLSVRGSADAGAARATAVAAPTRTAVSVRFALITDETLIDNSHIGNTFM